MKNQWSRRASFLSALFAAFVAGIGLSVADMLAAWHSQGDSFAHETLWSLFSRVSQYDLLIALPLGLWAGLVLYGFAAERSPRVLIASFFENLRPRPARLESVRLARIFSALSVVSLSMIALFIAAVPIFSRIVRSHNAAAMISLAALGISALSLSLYPSLTRLFLRLIRWREALGRWHKLFSLESLLFMALFLGSAAASYLWINRARFLYGVDLSPLLWGLGLLLLFALAWLSVALPFMQRLLIFMARPWSFTLSSGVFVAGLVMILQVVAEQGAHAGLLDGTGVASRVYDTLSEIQSSGKNNQSSNSKITVEVQPEVQRTGNRAPDVIIISIDALRADHLGSYGYKRPTSPAIDTLARQAMVFEQAFSAAPCTSSSFAGMLTSRLPSRIPGMNQDNEKFFTPPQTPSFIEHFRKSGYNTQGMLPLVPKYLNLVHKGFDHYVNFYGNARDFSDKVINTLSKEKHDHPDKPLFLWAHYLNVHFPYTSHPGWQDFGDKPIDLYDQEIAYTDSQLARVFAQLQWLGELQNAIIVVTADHGEAFYEHGTALHGDNLYQEQIHVPLIISAPGLARGERFNKRVSLLDLGPTLTDLAGIARLRYHTDGHSLLARLKGLDDSNPTLLVDACRAGSQMALVGDQKLYFQRRSGSFHLFDLLKDPKEKQNIFDLQPDLARPLVQRLRRELAKVGAR